MKTGHVVLLAVTAGLLGFGVYVLRQYQLALKYTYDIGNFKIKSFSKDKISFEFDFFIKNASKLDGKLKDIDLKLYLNGKHVGYIKEKVETVIQAESITKIPIGLDIEPQKSFELTELLPIVANVVSKNYGKITLQYKGNLEFHKIVDFNVPIDNTFTLAELLK